MKEYITPEVEFVAISTKEDILTGSFYDEYDQYQKGHGTRFVF